MKRRVVVLGGTGFIGRHVCGALAAKGHRITCVARHPPRPQLPREIAFVQSTLDDRLSMGALLEDADLLVHLAWDTTPGTSAMQPSLEGLNNLLPMLRLVEELHRHPECTVVFVSTGGALYPAEAVASRESSSLAPRSFYGAAKGAAELALQAFSAQAGNSVVVLRPSNVYGPGQHARRGFGIVPTLLQCALEGSTFDAWGTPETARDFLFVEDFVRLLTAVAERDWEPGQFARYNAGSGVALPVDTLCREVERVTGRTIRRRSMPLRPVDIARTQLDSSLAEAEFGWRASTALGTGLEATWRWFRSR